MKKISNNFSEVTCGLSFKEAIKEAKRCLQCKHASCIKGCPVGINIPAFIRLIRENNFSAALSKIKEKNNLPAICGRVCPQENQCEVMCILNKKGRPINIGMLERFAADAGSSPHTTAPCTMHHAHKGNIAIVGSGPAGLTCAADLAKLGYSVSLFESMHIPGGVLVYGIPEFRLPKKIVKAEIGYIKGLGVVIETDTLVGYTCTFEDLFKAGFKAIFLAVGAGLPEFLNVPGENLNNVYSANEFLIRINLMNAYKFPEYATPVNISKNTAVIGGGNVAIDSARAALRLGKKVTLIYRRTEKEMPARIEEIRNAKKEGVVFNFLSQPIRFLGEKGVVKGIECIKMKLSKLDESGRMRPVPVKGSNFIIGADTVIIAIGQRPNPLILKCVPGLKSNPNGTIIVDNNLMTSIPGVFAGGDITTGADTVISAMAAGKRAAFAIDKYTNDNL